MTRKDYVLLAKALRNAKPTNVDPVNFMDDKRYVMWLSCVCSVAHELSADNPRFETVQFLTACGD